MGTTHFLDRYLEESARSRPDHPAVEEGNYSITYQELSELSGRVSRRLCEQGVKPKDRVGVYLHKSIDSVASIFGILKAGATYVPVDPLAPASRNAYIFNNCAVKTAVVEDAFAGDLTTEMARLGDVPPLIATAGTGGGHPLDAALGREVTKGIDAQTATIPSPDDLAYILYTSGSTGKP